MDLPLVIRGLWKSDWLHNLRFPWLQALVVFMKQPLLFNKCQWMLQVNLLRTIFGTIFFKYCFWSKSKIAIFFSFRHVICTHLCHYCVLVGTFRSIYICTNICNNRFISVKHNTFKYLPTIHGHTWPIPITT